MYIYILSRSIVQSYHGVITIFSSILGKLECAVRRDTRVDELNDHA